MQMFFKSAPQPLVFWEETTHMMFKASMLKDHYWQCWQTICSARDRIQVGYVQGKFLSAMLSLEPILLFLFDCLFVGGGGILTSAQGFLLTELRSNSWQAQRAI